MLRTSLSLSAKKHSVAAAAAAASGSESEMMEANRTVFIDTSLDTHLAMLLSHLDTVSDLKRKIEKEHTLCFTNIGKVVVHALKVKRKGHLYHLSDYMFVKDAFDKANKDWFLRVDASSLDKHEGTQQVENPDSNKLLTCLAITSNAVADGVDLSGSPKQGPSDPNKGDEVPGMHVESKNDASKPDILEQCIVSVKETSKCDQVSKRKRRIEHLEEEIDSGKEISNLEIISQHPLEDKEKSKSASLDGLTKAMNEYNLMMNSTRNDLEQQPEISVEEASQSDQVAKRRRKIEFLQEENVDARKETSTAEVISQHHPGVKEKTETAPLDGLIAKPMDDDHLVTNISGRKERKRKKKSGKKLNQVVAEAPSSGKDVLGESYKVTAIVDHKDSGGGSDTTSVPRLGEHGITASDFHQAFMKENHSDNIEEVGEHATPAIDVGNKSDVSKEEAKSAASKKINSTNHIPVAVESNSPLVMKEPDDQQMDVGVSGHENSGTDHTKRAAEEGEGTLSKKGRRQSIKRHAPSQVKTVVKIQNVDGTADLLGEKGTIAPKKSSDRKKTTKKISKLVAKTLVTSGGEDIEGSELNSFVEPLEGKNYEQLDNKASNEENNLSPKSGKEGLEMNTENTTFLAKETDEVTGNRVKNMQQISKNQEDTENVENQVRKKLKKKRKASEKNLPDLHLEDQKMIHQTSTPPTDNRSEVVASSNTEKKGKLEEIALKDRSNEEKLESKNAGVESDFPSRGSKGKLEKPAVEDRSNRAANIPKAKKNTKNPDAHSDATSHEFQSSLKSNGNEGIEGERRARDSSTVPVQGSLSKDKYDESMVRPEKKLLKASRNGAKAPSTVVPDELNPIPEETRKHTAVNASKTNISSEKNTDSLSVSNSSLPKPRNSTSQNKRGNIRPVADGKAASNKVNGETVNASKKTNLEKNTYSLSVSNSSLSKSRNITNQNVRANICPVADGKTASDKVNTEIANASKKKNLEKNTDSLSVSNSSLSKSRNLIGQNVRGNIRHVSDGKAFKKANGEIVESSEHRKKVISTPGTIFKDDDGSSEDEEVDGSDASTRTPSDYLSSDYSDGESNANTNSPRTGSYTSARARNSIKSCSSSAKDMAFDAILKSSSRFKKAKLTASQLQLEDDSQPVDFVPDSQANQ